MKNEDNVYFLENIIPNYENSLVESNRYFLVLLKPSKELNLKDEADNYNFIIIESTKEHIELLHEGQYIFYKKGSFENANTTKIAKRNIFFNNLYRGKLLSIQKENLDQLDLSNSEISSYHINVGHGNSSLLVIKNSNNIQIWMVDCSNFDFISNNSYIPNIESYLLHIQKKFSIKEILIDKLFVTHPHFDHYSGIGWLIDKGLITQNTEFFINLHYSMPGENFNRLLSKIDRLKPRIVEPIAMKYQKNIEIWHPCIRTIRSNTSKYSGQKVMIEPNINNSSAVYFFNFGNKGILFPGDLETKGWNAIDCCLTYLKNCDYYVISHHGSINGHLRNKCPINRCISNLSDCVKPNSTQILLGRDGAFPGIFSSAVLNDFSNIITSERDKQNNRRQFLEIDWTLNKFKWI